VGSWHVGAFQLRAARNGPIDNLASATVSGAAPGMVTLMNSAIRRSY